MAIYKLKRKFFSGEEKEKKGMGIGTKLAIGTAALAGAGALAHGGYLGTGAQNLAKKGVGAVKNILTKKTPNTPNIQPLQLEMKPKSLPQT